MLKADAKTIRVQLNLLSLSFEAVRVATKCLPDLCQRSPQAAGGLLFPAITP